MIIIVFLFSDLFELKTNLHACYILGRVFYRNTRPIHIIVTGVTSVPLCSLNMCSICIFETVQFFKTANLREMRTDNFINILCSLVIILHINDSRADIRQSSDMDGAEPSGFRDKSLRSNMIKFQKLFLSKNFSYYRN